VLGHSFLSRNIPLRSIYSLVRTRAGKGKRSARAAPELGQIARFARNFGYTESVIRYAQCGALLKSSELEKYQVPLLISALSKYPSIVSAEQDCNGVNLVKASEGNGRSSKTT
jgi:hypothetical protein